MTTLRGCTPRDSPHPDDSAISKLFANAAVVIGNYGVSCNDEAALERALESGIKPLLRGLVQLSSPPTLLWRETLPQHFPTASGLYKNQTVKPTKKPNHKTDTGADKSCTPISAPGMQAARWRNTHFATWLAKHSKLKERVKIIDAWDAFVNRADLHVGPPDCTHFLYSPFTWRYVWDGIAKQLGSASQ